MKIKKEDNSYKFYKNDELNEKYKDEKLKDCNLYYKVIRFCYDIIDGRKAICEDEGSGQPAFYSAKESATIAKEIAQKFMNKIDGNGIGSKYINSGIIDEYSDYIYILAMIQNIKYVKLNSLVWSMPEGHLDLIKEISNNGADLFGKLFEKEVITDKDRKLFEYLKENIKKLEDSYENLMDIPWYSAEIMSIAIEKGLEGYIVNSANFINNSFLNLSYKLIQD